MREPAKVAAYKVAECLGAHIRRPCCADLCNRGRVGRRLAKAVALDIVRLKGDGPGRARGAHRSDHARHAGDGASRVTRFAGGEVCRNPSGVGGPATSED